MEFLKIRNWDRWQTYRTDRGLPPWIKVHRQILRNADWVALTDAQRGQLLAMWILAADKGGEIPSDPKVLKILCHMEHEPDLQLLAGRGFIDLGVNVTPTWRQPGVNVTPTCGIDVGSDEGQMKVREGKGREDTLSDGASDGSCPVSGSRKPKPDPHAADIDAVLTYLNVRRQEIAPTAAGYDIRAKGTRKHLRARLAEGATREQCIAIIDDRLADWRDRSEMHRFFRPATLFNEDRFPDYLANIGVGGSSEDAERRKFLAMGDD